jgi:hypothetical protein
MARVVDLQVERDRRSTTCRKCRAPMTYGRLLCAGCIAWHNLLAAHAQRVEDRRAEVRRRRRKVIA